MADEVLTERRGRVLLITLNRPEARNAINAELAEGLVRSIEELDGDDGLTAAVVTGAGRGFCSGMDLKAFAAGGPPNALPRFLQEGAAKPLVAAVEGFAMAGGLELALACDYRVVVDKPATQLGMNQIEWGLIPAWGGRSWLPQRTQLYSTAQRTLSSVTAQCSTPMPPPALKHRRKNERSSAVPR